MKSEWSGCLQKFQVWPVVTAHFIQAHCAKMSLAELDSLPEPQQKAAIAQVTEKTHKLFLWRPVCLPREHTFNDSSDGSDPNYHVL